MRTTVEIPDDLFRQAKAKAALDGMRLRDLVEKGLRLALDDSDGKTRRRRARFPLHRSRRPGALGAKDVRRAEETLNLGEDAAHVDAM